MGFLIFFHYFLKLVIFLAVIGFLVLFWNVARNGIHINIG